MSFQILGTGSFAPEKIVTNDDLSHMVETSDEWITKRVGVKQRHVCTTETATDMGVAAARRALENSGVKPEELGYDHCRHHQRGYHLPRLGGHGAKPHWGPLPLFRHQRGLPRLSLCPGCGRRLLCAGAGEEGAGGQCRAHERPDRLDRPEHLRHLCGDGAGAAVLGEGEGYLSSVLTTKGGEDVISIPTKWDNSPFYEHQLKQKTW